MFAHFDLNFNINDNLDFLYKINSFLPQDISVKSLKKVKNEAHARFDAISRKYEYIISRNKSPLFRNKVCYISKKLNISYYYLIFSDFLHFQNYILKQKQIIVILKMFFGRKKMTF